MNIWRDCLLVFEKLVYTESRCLGNKRSRSHWRFKHSPLWCTVCRVSGIYAEYYYSRGKNHTSRYRQLVSSALKMTRRCWSVGFDVRSVIVDGDHTQSDPTELTRRCDRVADNSLASTRKCFWVGAKDIILCYTTKKKCYWICHFKIQVIVQSSRLNCQSQIPWPGRYDIRLLLVAQGNAQEYCKMWGRRVGYLQDSKNPETAIWAVSVEAKAPY